MNVVSHVSNLLTLPPFHFQYGKQQKKLQKREAHEKQIERNQQESERIKLWLNAQFILARLGSAKNDLLQGENGAVVSVPRLKICRHSVSRMTFVFQL